MGGGWIGKQKCKVDQANGKDGLGAFDVLGVVDEVRKCLVEFEELLHGGMAGLLLAGDCKSAADGGANANELLEATNGEAIDSC